MLANILKSIKSINLATRVTLLRIGLIVPILILIQSPSPLTCFFATLFFFFASVSDFIDGYIARKSGQITTLGEFLDPLADKILVCTVLVELSALTWVPTWITNLIIAREFAVTGLRAIAADKNLVISADKYGKWKTVFQTLALGPLLYHYPLWGIPVSTIGMLLLYIALGLTLVSGINYFVSFYRVLMTETDKTENLL